jgi:hypothetical protein
VLNKHFCSSVARGAKRHQILWMIRQIDKSVVASSVKMVHVKPPSAWTMFGLAPDAAAIPTDDNVSDLIPPAPSSQPLATLVIRVVWANRVLQIASARAEHSIFRSASELSKWDFAIATRNMCGSDKTLVPTFPRAIIDGLFTWTMDDPATGTFDFPRSCLSSCCMALSIAVSSISSFLYGRLCSLKAGPAVRARVRITFDLRSSLALFAAVNCCRPVSLEPA